MQLWTQWSVENLNANYTAMHSIFRSNEGIEFNTGQIMNTANAQPSNDVIIPEITIPLSDEFILELQENINPLTPSQYHGVELYELTLQRVLEFRGQDI